MQITEINRMNNTDQPWYKFPLVWMMIAIPFSAIIMGVIMLWLAIDTDDGLVADDYYKQGLAINDVISRDKHAADLGLSAELDFDNSTKVIKALFNSGSLATLPDFLSLHLQHATRENSDVRIRLNKGIDNQYIGHAQEVIKDGVWYFELSDKGEHDANWKISARSHIRNSHFVNGPVDKNQVVNSSAEKERAVKKNTVFLKSSY